MTVLMISPGYPAEMAFFTRGLGQAGVRVIGLGDQSPDALPAEAKGALDHYVHTGSLAAEDHVAGLVREMARRIRIDQVECLWEPYMVLAARLREELGLPGLTVEQTVPFRDKERMKQLLDAAGLRTPWHVAARTVADVWAAAERVGYPLIVKPIDGAGSADTYRADSVAELDAILPAIRHVPQVSVEEFVDAEEFTYDTICAGGNVLVENICQYHPRPLVTKIHEWVSPVTMALRDLDEPGLQGGRELGHAVLRALGFTDGFTHMEWYRKADGEVVFGEIGARPPGARTVDVMNYATDADLFSGWAHAVTHGSIPFPVERRYNAASIFKRAQGAGRITHYEGLDRLLAEYGDHVAAIDLLPVGAPRRDWRATLIADGMVIVRHPELPRAMEMAEPLRRRPAPVRELNPGALPGPGGWPVAVQGLGLVLVPRGGRPVRVQDQGPAPAVDDDLVVEGAEQDAVCDVTVLPPLALCFVWCTSHADAGWLHPPAHRQCGPAGSPRCGCPPGWSRRTRCPAAGSARPAGRRAAGGAGSSPGRPDRTAGPRPCR